MSLAYKLISLWFIITAPVVMWDAAYCFMRPDSMKGGWLHWIWAPYGLYEEIDYIYGPPSYESHNGFTNAQALLNVVETALNLRFLYLYNIAKSPGAPVVGFASIMMTLGKTLLYLLQEYYCGWCNTRQNNWFTFLVMWILPNGLWIVFPSIISWKLASDISANLHANAKKRSGTKSE